MRALRIILWSRVYRRGGVGVAYVLAGRNRERKKESVGDWTDRLNSTGVEGRVVARNVREDDLYEKIDRRNHYYDPSAGM